MADAPTVFPRCLPLLHGRPAPMLSSVKRQLCQAAVLLGAVGFAFTPSAAYAHGKPTAEGIDTARGHGNVVSFTFDDGPNPPDTYAMLAVLRKHHVRAVFCLWGDHVIAHPEVVR